jgi:AcrR family transcriptional regulator
MAATKPLKPLSVARREPTQQRAERTIETLFKATAQIVESDGIEALSTNKIAAKAGFSVGTLYQYFPSKEAILLAMITGERARVQHRLSNILSKAELLAPDPRGVMVDLIHELVQSFGTGRNMRRTLIRLAWQMDHHDEITSNMREASERISVALARISARADGSPAQPKLRTHPAALFVVSRAVMGAIRSASLEKSALLGSPEFEEELLRLAWSLLVQD